MNDATALGSNRLTAHFWKSRLLKDSPTPKENRGLGPSVTAYIPLAGDHLASGNISRWTKHATFKYRGVRFTRTPAGAGFSDDPANRAQLAWVGGDTDEKRLLGEVEEMGRQGQRTLFMEGRDKPPAVSNARKWGKLREGPQGAAGGRGDYRHPPLARYASARR